MKRRIGIGPSPSVRQKGRQPASESSGTAASASREKTVREEAHTSYGMARQAPAAIEGCPNWDGLNSAVGRALRLRPRVKVRPMEMRLLSMLARSPDRVVSTEDILKDLYGDISMDAGRIRLRRLVADIRGRVGGEIADRLRTVPRVGLLLRCRPDRS